MMCAVWSDLNNLTIVTQSVQSLMHSSNIMTLIMTPLVVVSHNNGARCRVPVIVFSNISAVWDLEQISIKWYVFETYIIIIIKYITHYKILLFIT